MTYFLWALPTLAVLAMILSGRASTTLAALTGLVCALPVALLSGPATPDAGQLREALLRGLWIGATIAPYILGGLLFWQVAARASPGQAVDAPALDAGATRSPLARRRLVFFACFLVGPFAESATGFGVGMLGTVVLIRGLGFAPRHLMVFALLSQTLIPWGAMGSGTLLAAAYARIAPAQLGLHALGLVALLMPLWLALFWRTARQANLAAPRLECLRELGWVLLCLALLGVATEWLGPETALLAAYGPMIVLRYLIDFRPGRRAAWVALRRALPHVLLIGSLALGRLVPEIRRTLETTLQVAPFADMPAWAPFFHAGSWLIAGALLSAWARGQGRFLGQEARSAWATGRHAVLTVFLFAMMAEVLTASGISGAFAAAMFHALGEQVLLITPLVSGAFGILTNSGNPSNSLFLPSQVALALQAGLSVPAVAALQHVCGMSMGLFSPVRMSIAAGLAGGHGQERKVYAQLLPYAALALGALLAAAAWTMSTQDGPPPAMSAALGYIARVPA